MFVVFLGALLRWGMKCDEGCYLRQLERGYSWTRYGDSWQWHAQFAVASVALATAAAAIYLSSRRHPGRAAVALITAVLLSGAWIGWYSATPLHS